MNKFFANKISLETIAQVNELFFNLYKLEAESLDYKLLSSSTATVDLNTYFDYLSDSGNVLHLAYFRNTISAGKLKKIALKSPFPILFFSKPGNETVPCIVHNNDHFIIENNKAVKIKNIDYYLDNILTFKDKEPGKNE